MAAASTVRPAYPEHLRVEVERYLEALRFSDEFATAGLEEAMRYSLLAGGKRIRPVLALATASALGLDRATMLPLAGGDRADPHLLADPRRSAGDGRRRSAPRAADVPQGVRRRRRDPGRRRAVRRGVQAPADGAARRPGRRARGRRGARDRDRRPGHGRRSVHGRRRNRAGSGADGLRHLHELKTGPSDRGEHRVPAVAGRGAQTCHNLRVPRLRRASWACFSRSSTTSST